MVAFALRKGEYEPAHAGDAREAQESIANRVPDLILLDWMLPGTSGIELARRWRREELTREIPRSEEHTSELQSLMRISYAVFCLTKKKKPKKKIYSVFI